MGSSSLNFILETQPSISIEFSHRSIVLFGCKMRLIFALAFVVGLIGLNNGYGIGSGSGSGNGGSGSNAGSGQQGACQSPLWEAKKEYEFEYHGTGETCTCLLLRLYPQRML